MSASSIVRSFLLALSFLTRIPVRVEPDDPVHSDKPGDIGRSIAFFPLIGLFIGIVSLVVFFVVHSDVLVAVGIVAFQTLLTGGLHLDGFADVADAYGGGRGDRERMLEIMRDSRIGAHGSAALTLLLMAKIFAILEIIEIHPYEVLVLFPVVSRFSVACLIVVFPYARSEGLGKRFHEQARFWHLLPAAATTLVAVAWAGRSAYVPAMIAFLAAFLFAWWVSRKLQGLTGDVYGACLEIAEVAFLIAVASA